LINNGSEPAEWEKIDAELKKHKNCIVIINQENMGFVKAVNRGLQYITSPYVVLMNNDTQAVPLWIEKLSAPFRIPQVMLTGPLTTTPESWQGKYTKGRKGWIVRESGMLAFFCTMFRATVFTEIGVLDESFGVGFGDDDDYCMRVTNAGYKMALVQDLIIPHYHRSTFRKIYDEATIKEMQEKAIEKFKVKHRLG
jgi:GT2 family glycosyltransferase